MRKDILLAGIIILVGTFLVTQIFISSEQKQRIDEMNAACGASFFGIPIGEIGQSLDPDVARECEEARNALQLYSLAPLAYLIGIILLVLGFVLRTPGTKS